MSVCVWGGGGEGGSKDIHMTDEECGVSHCMSTSVPSRYGCAMRVLAGNQMVVIDSFDLLSAHAMPLPLGS